MIASPTLEDNMECSSAATAASRTVSSQEDNNLSLELLKDSRTLSAEQEATESTQLALVSDHATSVISQDTLS